MRKAEHERDGQRAPAYGVDRWPGAAGGDTAAAVSASGAPASGNRTPSATGPEMEALERELTVLYRRARASSWEMARQIHPDLEAAAYGLLVRLEETRQERATDLAGYFGVGKATMSRQLKALEALGFVSREPDPADGRAFLVALTDEGRARFNEVRDARRAGLRGRLTAWDHGDLLDLARLLRRLNADAAM